MLKEQLTRIENKVDKLDGKLDNHLSRISTLEEAMHWMKGHVKILTALGTTIVSGLILYLITKK